MTDTMRTMVREYNRLTGKHIERFSSKAAAERQLAQARQRHAAQSLAPLTDTNRVRTQNRSAATKKQWNNKTVARARAARDPVVVQGHGEFKSVAKAFQALNIPRTSMIKFRLALKKDGGRSIQTNNGTTYQFFLLKHKGESSDG